MIAFEAILEFQDADFVPTPYEGSGQDRPWAPLLQDALYAEFLREYNGLYAFDRALHLFGSDPSRPADDLTLRNDPTAGWRGLYGPKLKDLWFFAEDLFGHLYGMRGQDVVAFNPETGNVEIVAEGFRGWLKFIEEDIDYTTGQSLAQEWSEENAEIEFGTRLAPLVPFVVGGDFAIENLRPVAWEENLERMSEVYAKIKDLPEGAEVEL